MTRRSILSTILGAPIAVATTPGSAKGMTRYGSALLEYQRLLAIRSRAAALTFYAPEAERSMRVKYNDYPEDYKKWLLEDVHRVRYHEL